MLQEISLSTSKKQEIIDITSKVQDIVKKTGIKDGICVVYTTHATAAILINENWDPNILLDTIEALDKIIPQGRWRHDKVDNNGAAHIKSAIIGPSETIIIKDGELLLGRWQSIMLADFDGPRKRKVLIKTIEC